jgi:hypothetical protein
LRSLPLIFGMSLLSLTLIFAEGQRVEAAKAQKSPQEHQDFGVSGIEVRSVKSLDTKKLNAEVSKAASKGEAWTKDAILVALKVTGTELKGNKQIVEVRTPPEQRDKSTVTVTNSGYLDDAVGGERWRLWLEKGAEGTWTIKRVLWAQLCTRPGHIFYSAEKCP